MSLTKPRTQLKLTSSSKMHEINFIIKNAAKGGAKTRKKKCPRVSCLLLDRLCRRQSGGKLHHQKSTSSRLKSLTIPNVERHVAKNGDKFAQLVKRQRGIKFDSKTLYRQLKHDRTGFTVDQCCKLPSSDLPCQQSKLTLDSTSQQD